LVDYILLTLWIVKVQRWCIQEKIYGVHKIIILKGEWLRIDKENSVKWLLSFVVIIVSKNLELISSYKYFEGYLPDI